MDSLASCTADGPSYDIWFAVTCVLPESLPRAVPMFSPISWSHFLVLLPMFLLTRLTSETLTCISFLVGEGFPLLERDAFACDVGVLQDGLAGVMRWCCNSRSAMANCFFLKLTWPRIGMEVFMAALRSHEWALG